MTSSVSEQLTVVEASAGTGKTHRITELVVEHVTRHGVPIERILVVTFTRAATAELRDRIRRALGEAAADEAMTSFDLATITTIHGFCHQVLRSLGLIDDMAGAITTDDGDLRSEVLNDAVLREVAGWEASSPLVELFAPAGADPVVTESRARDFVRLLLTHPTADVVVQPESPTGRGTQPVAPELLDEWRSFLRNVADAVLARRSSAGVLTHDDVLRLARDAVLSDPTRARAVADRFDLVLIDEFQDTDSLQWQLFEAAFLADRRPDDPRPAPRMFVVGDPKQAIYSFRGADVHAYLAARSRAGSRDTLTESWRMEPSLLAATNLLFRGSTFGVGTISHTDLHPPAVHTHAVLTDDPLPAPLVVRAIEPPPRSEEPPKGKGVPFVRADEGRALGAQDVASVIDELLSSDARIERAGQEPARLAPRDIAVLVGRHHEADAVADALAARGIRSVRRGNDSVMASPAAEQWQWLLRGMDRPFSTAAASLAALSWFVGSAPDELAGPDADERLGAVQDRLAEWRRTLAASGIAAVLAVLRETSGVTERVLGRLDGERDATDLEHVAELLHDAVPGPTTPGALLDVLERSATSDEEAEDHAARRIDSDDDAVQVLTIHASKGLQFAITLVPFLWTMTVGRDQRLLPDEHGVVIDATVGPRDPVTRGRAEEEAFGTLQRLTYVALTRARHRTVVWWANAHNTPRNPLTDLLLHRSADAQLVTPDGTGAPAKGDVDVMWGRLHDLAQHSDGTIAVTPAVPGAPARRQAAPSDEPLEVNTFTRRLDRRWRRHSFSAITAPARHAHVAELVPADDEPTAVETMPDGTAGPAGVDGGGPLLSLTTSGAEFGTAFHTVMQHLDFAAADRRAEITRVVDERWPWASIAVPRDVLAAGIDGVLTAPTGPWLGNRPLRELTRRDRLDELTFELPMATTGRAVRAREIGVVLTDHLDDDDPFSTYAHHLRGDAFDLELAGYLTGSIDLVARTTGPDGTARFTVCDYKTNRLPAPPGTPPLGAYHPARLPAEMVRHHYPLQALLYSVALHRFLRWRLAGYDPARHLAGAAYLFVRGMVGPTTPVTDGRPVGVCGWDIPPALTIALSELLDGSSA